MKNLELLMWFQNWYASQCDGEWEHDKRIRIGTIDNPGWSVSINLKGTFLEGKHLETKKNEKNDGDWVYYWVKDDTFEAAGGASNLVDILNIFKGWVETGVI